MQAVILAGGKGTRLKNILKGKPKCLAELLGSTILDNQINEKYLPSLDCRTYFP